MLLFFHRLANPNQPAQFQNQKVKKVKQVKKARPKNKTEKMYDFLNKPLEKIEGVRSLEDYLGLNSDSE